MIDNHLVPHAAEIGRLLEKNLPPGVGYVLILTDLKTNDMAASSSIQRWQRPEVLRAAANALELQLSPLDIPGFPTDLIRR